MDLFLKLSVLQANFCWLGDLEKMICPWKESIGGGGGGKDKPGWELVFKIAGMWYLSATSF